MKAHWYWLLFACVLALTFLGCGRIATYTCTCETTCDGAHEPLALDLCVDEAHGGPALDAWSESLPRPEALASYASNTCLGVLNVRGCKACCLACSCTCQRAHDDCAFVGPAVSLAMNKE
jgi:hypothetical protein